MELMDLDGNAEHEAYCRLDGGASRATRPDVQSASQHCLLA